MKKNTLLIIPFLTDGGAERVVSELSIALGRRFNIFLLLYEDRITYPFHGRKILLGNSKNYSHPIWGIFNKVLFLRKLKKEYKIDYSISFLVNPNLVNVLSRRKEKVILTVHTHLTDYYKRKKWLERLKNKLHIRLIYNCADYVIGVSKGVENDLQYNFKIKEEKLRTIYNFYDFDQINNLSNQRLNEDHVSLYSKPVIINVGRLTYSKGQWNLLKAFKMVRRELDVNLVILGEGKYYSEYITFIENNGLKNSVFLLGFQTNPYPLIKASSILVSSSKFEGLSNVILESLILGTPVIATDCRSGPREILAPDQPTSKAITQTEFHKNGVLLPLIHPEIVNIRDELSSYEKEMANAIIKVLKSDELRQKHSLNGVKRSKYFCAENQILEWLKLLG